MSKFVGIPDRYCLGVPKEVRVHDESYKPEGTPFQACDDLASWYLPGKRVWPEHAVKKLSRNCAFIAKHHNYGEPNDVVVPLFVYSSQLYRNTTWGMYVLDPEVNGVWREVRLYQELEDLYDEKKVDPDSLFELLATEYNKGTKDRKVEASTSRSDRGTAEADIAKVKSNIQWEIERVDSDEKSPLTLYNLTTEESEGKRRAILARYSVSFKEIKNQPDKHPLADTVAWLPEVDPVAKDKNAAEKVLDDIKELPTPEQLEYVHSRMPWESLDKPVKVSPYMWKEVGWSEVSWTDDPPKDGGDYLTAEYLKKQCLLHMDQQKYVEKLKLMLDALVSKSEHGELIKKKAGERPLPCRVLEALQVQELEVVGVNGDRKHFFAALTREPRVICSRNKNPVVLTRFFGQYSDQPYFHLNAVLRSKQNEEVKTTVEMERKGGGKEVFTARINAGQGVSLMLRANESIEEKYNTELAQCYQKLQKQSWMTVLWNEAGTRYARWGPAQEAASEQEEAGEQEAASEQEETVEQEEVDCYLQRKLAWYVYETGPHNVTGEYTEPERSRLGPGTWLQQQLKPMIYFLGQALRNLSKSVACKGVGAPTSYSTVLEDSMQCYRGMGGSNLDPKAYQNGNVVLWSAFSSTSSSQGVALDFTTGKKGASTIFMIKGKSCRRLALWSRFTREEEWLYPMNTKFCVTSMLTDGLKKLLDKEFLQVFEIDEVDTKGMQVIPVRQLLGHAKNDMQARIVLRAIAAIENDHGVLDLSRTEKVDTCAIDARKATETGGVPANTKWQKAQTVKYDDAGKCPLKRTITYGVCDEGDAKVLWERAQERASENGIELSAASPAVFTLDTVDNDNNDTAQDTDGVVLKHVSKILGLATEQEPEFVTIWSPADVKADVKAATALTVLAQMPSQKWGILIELRMSDVKPADILRGETEMLQKVLKLGVNVSKINLRNNGLNEADLKEVLKGVRKNANVGQVIVNDAFKQLKELPWKKPEHWTEDLEADLQPVTAVRETATDLEPNLPPVEAVSEAAKDKERRRNKEEILLRTIDVRCLHHKGELRASTLQDFGSWWPVFAAEALHDAEVIKADYSSLFDRLPAETCWFVRLLVKNCKVHTPGKYPKLPGIVVGAARSANVPLPFIRLLLDINQECGEYDEYGEYACLKLMRRLENEGGVQQSDSSDVEKQRGGNVEDCDKLKDKLKSGSESREFRTRLAQATPYTSAAKLKAFGLSTIRKYHRKKEDGWNLIAELKQNLGKSLEDLIQSAGGAETKAMKCKELSRVVPIGQAKVTLLLYDLCEQGKTKAGIGCTKWVNVWEEQKDVELEKKEEDQPEDGKRFDRLMKEGPQGEKSSHGMFTELQMASLNLLMPKVYGGMSRLETSKHIMQKWAMSWSTLCHLSPAEERYVSLERKVLCLPETVLVHHLRLRTGSVYLSPEPTLWKERPKTGSSCKVNDDKDGNTLHFVVKGWLRPVRIATLCEEYDVLLPALNTFIVTGVKYEGKTVTVSMSARCGLFRSDPELSQWREQHKDQVETAEGILRSDGTDPEIPALKSPGTPEKLKDGIVDLRRLMYCSELNEKNDDEEMTVVFALYFKKAGYLLEKKRGDVYDTTKTLLGNVSKFSYYKVGTSKDNWNPCSLGVEEGLQGDRGVIVPITLKPAFTFLEQLGRVVDKRDKAEYLPPCSFEEKKEEVVISAETMYDAHHADFDNADVFAAGGGRKHVLSDCKNREEGIKAIQEKFGEGSFVMQSGEIDQLVKSTRVVTSNTLPKKFYEELVSNYTSKDKHRIFFTLMKAIPLSEYEKRDKCEEMKLRLFKEECGALYRMTLGNVGKEYRNTIISNMRRQGRSLVQGNVVKGLVEEFDKWIEATDTYDKCLIDKIVSSLPKEGTCENNEVEKARSFLEKALEKRTTELKELKGIYRSSFGDDTSDGKARRDFMEQEVLWTGLGKQWVKAVKKKYDQWQNEIEVQKRKRKEQEEEQKKPEGERKEQKKESEEEKEKREKWEKVRREPAKYLEELREACPAIRVFDFAHLTRHYIDERKKMKEGTEEKEKWEEYATSVVTKEMCDKVLADDADIDKEAWFKWAAREQWWNTTSHASQEVTKIDDAKKRFDGSLECPPVTLWIDEVLLKLKEEHLENNKGTVRESIIKKWVENPCDLEGVEFKEMKSEFAEWVKGAEKKYSTFGFDSRWHAVLVCSKSILELASEVCISQAGYFFTSGTDNNMNHLAKRNPERTAEHIVFLSVSAIDFTAPEEKKKLKEKKAEVFPRVKALFQTAFRAAKDQGVRNVSALLVGLGAKVDGKENEDIVEANFRAQFELLSEEDWGFDNYYISTRDLTMHAQSVLKEGLQEGKPFNNKRENTFLRCNVVLHNKDAKFLAQKLAEKGEAPGFMIPSSYAALLLGKVGHWWEMSRSMNYTTEEDWVATGTGVLGDFSICGKELFKKAQSDPAKPGELVQKNTGEPEQEKSGGSEKQPKPVDEARQNDQDEDTTESRAQREGSSEEDSQKNPSE